RRGQREGAEVVGEGEQRRHGDLRCGGAAVLMAAYHHAHILRDPPRFLPKSSAPVTLCSRNWRTTGRPERRFRVNSDALRSPQEFAMATKVKPVPDGYHTITPYLVVDGAEKVIRFMKEAFGAQPV